MPPNPPAENRKQVSINDVATDCGCSIATVSYALNGRGNISEATRKRVMKAAARLGYLPNSAGRSLRLQRTNTIGLFFYPSCAQLFRNIFYADVMEGLEGQLANAGYDLLLCGGNFALAEARPIALMAQRRIDAAIMLGAFPFKLIERLSGIGVPLMLLDSNLDALPVDSVTTDGFSAGKMVVDHLYARGHRRILMLAYRLEDYNIDLRVSGFLAGMKAHGLPARNSVIRTFVLNSEGFGLLAKRLSSPAAPTAVVCVNDTMATYMIQRMRETGHRVPEDVSFVGYDDDACARECMPALTTIAVDKGELGRVGADSLLRRLRDAKTPIGKARLPVRLVERDSVATIA